MLRHFNVWPSGLNKDDLFEEQKIFLIYLMGLIPDYQGWSMHVDYQTRAKKIEDMKKVKISKTDIDLAKMHNKSLSELEKEKLKQEKKRLLRELNEKFGVETKAEKQVDMMDGIIQDNSKDENPQKKQLWDMLNGKGLINQK